MTKWANVINHAKLAACSTHAHAAIQTEITVTMQPESKQPISIQTMNNKYNYTFKIIMKILEHYQKWLILTKRNLVRKCLSPGHQ